MVRAGSYQATRCRALGGERRAGRSFAGQSTWSTCGHIEGQARRSSVARLARQVAVDLAGDVALEDTHDLGLGASLGEAAFDVDAGAFDRSPCG